jgi:hypothetical protein
MAINTYGLTELPYVCIISSVAMLFNIIWLIYLYIKSQSNVLRIPEPARIRYQVNSEVVKYQVAGSPAPPADGSSSENPCIVCLGDYEIGESMMILTCEHTYHRDCIMPWLKTNGQCPICRSEDSVIEN